MDVQADVPDNSIKLEKVYAPNNNYFTPMGALPANTHHLGLSGI